MAQEINGTWEILGLINAVKYSIAGKRYGPELDDAGDKVWRKIWYGNIYFYPVNILDCALTEAKLEPDIDKWAKMALGND